MIRKFYEADDGFSTGFTTPPDELDMEVQRLIEKFMPYSFYGSDKDGNIETWDKEQFNNAKQCAIIHIQGLIDENDSMFKMAELHMDARTIIVLSHRLSHLNHLRQKIKSL